MERDGAVKILCQYQGDNLEKYGILAIGLFGSVARSEAGDNSGLDVCIQTKVLNIFNIKDKLQTLFSSKVDVARVREKTNPFLQKCIEKDTIYV